jgi:hypothetical protein
MLSGALPASSWLVALAIKLYLKMPYEEPAGRKRSKFRPESKSRPERIPVMSNHLSTRHGRACPGHPDYLAPSRMIEFAATSKAMTRLMC